MPEYRNRLLELMDAYTKNEISEAGFDELCELVKGGKNSELKEFFEIELRTASFKAMDKQKLDRMLGEILHSRESGVGSRERPLSKSLSQGERLAPVRSLPDLLARSRNDGWWRKIAAAVAVVVLGTGAYFMFFNKTAKQTEIVQTQQERFRNDVEPPKEIRAMITLADGRKVYLDSATNGSLAVQGNVKLVKLSNGQIAYQASPNPSAGGEQYNTLSNPRGSKVIDMTLSDGSHVWLNAGSSVTYPVAFIGNERKVSITGEAYFEITHLTPTLSTSGEGAVPFIVEKGDMQVRVLGTHFNVNAYDDEADIKVTLLEGSVAVSRESSVVRIKPGEQAQVGPSTPLRVTANVDVEEVMAWKNGKFVLDDASIESIMHEVERWYDAEIIFKEKINYHFVGSLPRDVPVSKLLMMLELTGRVRFLVEGKKITVMN
ncbi:MAG: FecR domain-containing protein [Chitinophagaceae bacterium]